MPLAPIIPPGSSIKRARDELEAEREAKPLSFTNAAAPLALSRQRDASFKCDLN
jgi:hypothetical protein